MLTLPWLVVDSLHRDDVQLPVAAVQAVRVATHNIVRRGWYLAPSQKPVVIGRLQNQARRDTYWYADDASPVTTRYPSTHIQVHNQTLLTIGHAWHKRGYRVALSNPLSLQYHADELLQDHIGARDSLLRSSGIHDCLTPVWSTRIPQTTSHRLLVTPRLPVFRSYAGDLLEQPWCADVITTDTPATPHNPYAIVDWERDLQRWITRLCGAAQHCGANVLVIELWSGMLTGLVAQIIRTTLQQMTMSGLAAIDFAIPDVTFQRTQVHPFVEALAGVRVINPH